MEVNCNICGGTEFIDFKNRGKVKCVSCGGHDRARVFMLYLQKYADLKKGQKVLHLAPERATFKYIAERVGDGYDPRDLDVERYKGLKHDNVQVRRIDLCTDTAQLPSDHYDLILHNHVMEHLPCNVTAVLYHLHRALKPGGLHMFTVPIIGTSWEESFADLSKDERHERFGQWDHVRRFAASDLDRTLGQLFDIGDGLKTTLLDHFGEEQLRKYNIPAGRWSKFTGVNAFMLRKDDLLLKP